jgi:hypothetical protein
MAEFNKIIEFIKYILKIFIYFDTKLVYIQSGGAPVVASIAAPIVADALANKMNDQGGTSNNNNNNNNKEVENKEFLWFIKEIKDIVMSVLEWIGSKLLSLASMLLFASTAPILPFFISMAGMFGVLKFFMYKLRRL